MHTRHIIAAAVVALTTACSTPAADRQTTAAYDPETGRLTTLTTDANGNGTPDTTSYMDGARIERIELDLDENGRVERWDFYASGGTLEKVGLSRENDGVMDSLAYYGAADALIRLEVSTARDGVYDRVEFYEDGRLVRSTEDTDRDGRPDKWDTYDAVAGSGSGRHEYAVASTAIDETGSGRPERRFVFGAGGAIARIEVDPDGDGIFVQP